MARVKRGVTGHAKHKKVFKAAKGYYGRRKNTIRIAKQAVEKANHMRFATANAASEPSGRCGFSGLTRRCSEFGLTYSRFIAGLGKAGVMVDRKVLSDLASTEPAAFQAIVDKARRAGGLTPGNEPYRGSAPNSLP